MITIEQIQQRLANEITSSNISQAEIARSLGVRHQQVSWNVLGQKMPALDTLANLCKILDVDTNYILCQDLSD